jgi:hypothetical protein
MQLLAITTWFWTYSQVSHINPQPINAKKWPFFQENDEILYWK